MQEKRYLAHIADDGREQTVLQHLQGTAALSGKFAKEFDDEDQGYLVGMAHDLGKYSEEFQNRLLYHGPKVDHSTAGAIECLRRKQLLAAIAVAGHHGGLPDGGCRTDLDSTFLGRYNKAMKGGIPCYDGWQRELTLPQLPPVEEMSGPESMFHARMLYSCLTDADYLDTEAFMSGSGRECNKVDMELLWSRLQQYIAPWFPPRGELNKRRCEILQSCIDQGKCQKPGLFTLTVPTGGGKTVASLAFALAQARTQKLHRVIYVIPYTSIIEQTADVFRKILGEDQVLEHHSGVLFDIGQEATPEQIRQARATENWDLPVVVTTAVQFFESLYASRSSKCRKLHNLANSVIIFDEAQMLPLNYLRPCVFAMAQLVKRYGASVVLCTATQPALGSIFREFLPGVTAIELCPPEIFQREDFRRVTFRRLGETAWTEVADKMNGLPQVLCIVNSRKNARTLYELLEKEGNFHLSTLMCPAHRRRQLAQIRKRLKDGQPCRVVSTSLIEAGVDVDFPVVYREEAGLDSILQAAGRCNREGKRSAADSIVTVFRSETDPPLLFRTVIDVGRLTMDRYEDLFSRETIQAYFRELLAVKGKSAQDQKGIMNLMERELFPFRKVEERFRLIENNTKTVYIPLDREMEDLLDQLRQGYSSRSLFRKLGQYSVNIYDQDFRALNEAGALETVDCDAYILRDMCLYEETTGLSLTADSGQALFV